MSGSPSGASPSGIETSGSSASSSRRTTRSGASASTMATRIGTTRHLNTPPGDTVVDAMRNVLTAIAAACLLAACNKPATPEPSSAPPPAPGPSPATPTPAPASPSSTGPLSEAEFKALHQLRTDEPPPRRGQRIDLAGTSAYLSLPEGATAPLPGIVVIH